MCFACCQNFCFVLNVCLPGVSAFFSRSPWTMWRAPRTMNGSFFTRDFVNVFLRWNDLFRWVGVKMPSISSVPILTSVCWQRINHIDSFSSPSVRILCIVHGQSVSSRQLASSVSVLFVIALFFFSFFFYWRNPNSYLCSCPLKHWSLLPSCWNPFVSVGQTSVEEDKKETTAACIVFKFPKPVHVLSLVLSFHW